MHVVLPALSLVVLAGPSGCGKSTFAGRHFGRFEVVSSDFCRALVANDENDQAATRDAFAVLHDITSRRLERGLLTVIDATSVTPAARRPLIALARRHHVDAVAIVLDLPEDLCVERNRARAERSLQPDVVRRQSAQLHESMHNLRGEGFAEVFVLDDPTQIEAAVIERRPLANDLRDAHGPFDIIGDVHGCSVELLELLRRLGYGVHAEQRDGDTRYAVEPPIGRSALFVGDLVDRGPDTPGVLRIVMAMVESGTARCVQGNHDAKLAKALRGRKVQVKNGLEDSLAQLEGGTAACRERVVRFLDGLVSHYVLDDGRLVVAHAGLTERLHGRESAKIRAFTLYGQTTGRTDELGLPVRLDWAAGYRGPATVVYGHTPVMPPEWRNNTINIDTGCVFGGRLTALRYPERELVSVPAARAYSTPKRPFPPADVVAPPPAAAHHQPHAEDESLRGNA